MISEDGPFVNAATICRDVIRDDAGGISLIRMFDRLLVTVGESGEFELRFHLFLALRAGKKTGPLRIKMDLLYPSGQRGDEITQDVVLSELGTGVNLDVNVRIGTNEIGVYWFVIAADEEEIARVPLTVLLRSK